jgi:excisionase family DNA binding protein
MYKPERIRQLNGLGAVVETYWTIEELAGYLKIAEQTIRRWVLNREIPFHKIHKVIRFRVSEIEKWIDGERNEELGIRNEEYKARGLNVHAWRHFCNTELQKGGMTVKKVQAVTGHKTEEMTDRYTHLDPMELKEVTEIQAALLAGKQEGEKKGRPALTLVKTSIDEKAEKNNQAS